MTDTADDWYWEKNWNDYRRGSKRVRISWNGGEAEAVIFDEGVPTTASAFLNRLPLEVRVVHVAWSGEMVMSTGGHALGVTEQENRVRLVRVGDLAFDPKFDEITLTYGTAEARLPDGPNVLTVFGQITNGIEEAAAFGRRTRFEGMDSLTFEAL